MQHLSVYGTPRRFYDVHVAAQLVRPIRKQQEMFAEVCVKTTRSTVIYWRKLACIVALQVNMVFCIQPRWLGPL
jgi:hypothetical protein